MEKTGSSVEGRIDETDKVRGMKSEVRIRAVLCKCVKGAVIYYFTSDSNTDDRPFQSKISSQSFFRWKKDESHTGTALIVMQFIKLIRILIFP